MTTKTPSEYFNRPILGRVKTRELKMSVTQGEQTREQILPAEEYDVIEVINLGKANGYVTNQWYKEYRYEPLIIAENITELFTPKTPA